MKTTNASNANTLKGKNAGLSVIGLRSPDLGTLILGVQAIGSLANEL